MAIFCLASLPQAMQGRMLDSLSCFLLQNLEPSSPGCVSSSLLPSNIYTFFFYFLFGLVWVGLMYVSPAWPHVSSHVI